MAGLSHELECKCRIEEIIAVDEIQARAHGALDLFLEVVVDAEALEVVDGGHHLPGAVPTFLQSLLHACQALLQQHMQHFFSEHFETFNLVAN